MTLNCCRRFFAARLRKRITKFCTKQVHFRSKNNTVLRFLLDENLNEKQLLGLAALNWPVLYKSFKTKAKQTCCSEKIEFSFALLLLKPFN